jgi:hypothetical protein
MRSEVATVILPVATQVRGKRRLPVIVQKRVFGLTFGGAISTTGSFFRKCHTIVLPTPTPVSTTHVKFNNVPACAAVSFAASDTVGVTVTTAFVFP